jgi:hypothetical protein
MEIAREVYRKREGILRPAKHLQVAFSIAMVGDSGEM